jgi:hypothetical protein
MTAKLNKELQTENSELQGKLIILKQNYEKLSADHKTFQTDHKTLQTKLLSETFKRNPECKNSEKTPGNKVTWKKRKTYHEPANNVLFVMCKRV